MVPVTVHEVFGRISFGLVQQRIRVRGDFHGAVYVGHINQLGSIRGQAVIINSGRDIRKLLAPAQFPVPVRRTVQLSTLQEEDGQSIRTPAGR